MITEKEKQIIRILRKNSKKSVATIGILTGLPKSTAFDKIQKLSKEAIVKNTCLLDFKKVGFNASLLFFAKTQNNISELRSHLANHPSVNSLHTSTKFNFIFEAVFQDNIELQKFIEELNKKFPDIFLKRCVLMEEVCREKLWRDET